MGLTPVGSSGDAGGRRVGGARPSSHIERGNRHAQPAEGEVLDGTRQRFVAIVFAGIWVGVGIITMVQSYLFAVIDDAPVGFWDLIGWQMASWVLWALLTPVVLYLGRKVSPLDHGWSRWIGFHLVVAVAIAVLHAAVSAGFGRLLAGPQATFWATFTWIFQSRFVFFLLIYFAILGSGLAIDYYHKYRERQLAASRLQTQLAGAQLDTLRMQLHPHFLFNTLQAVSVLIDENPRAASTMVTKLGDFLRHTIDTTAIQEIPLREELEFLRLYLDIEETRFLGRLETRYEVDEEALDGLVPSFILQPMVENAVKHGVSKHRGTAWIAISARRSGHNMKLSVEDGGSDRELSPVAAWHDGVGLANTRERLARLYGEGASSLEPQLRESGVRIEITLPFRRDAAEADRLAARG